MTKQERQSGSSGMADGELWRRLATMRIEPERAALTFAAKLARENGWDRQLAEAVVEEYRRFLLLAATAGRAVSPSPAVDKAWHLHLTYSRHYWDVLCGQIIGRPLHHDPSLGGAAEDARHRHQYQTTIELYRKTFGTEPPAAIWPGAAAAGHKPSRVRLATLTGGAVLAAFATAAAAATSGQDEFDSWFIPLVIAVFAVIFIAGIVQAATKKGGHRRGDGSGSDGCGSSDSWDSSDSGSDGGSSCGGGCGGGD